MNAIKEHSEAAPTRTVFTHTGWRHIEKVWVYLHAGGGLGTRVPVEVELARELQRHALPDLKDRKDQFHAIGASLGVLDVAPRSITIPLLATVYLAPLVSFLRPRPGFTPFLHGESQLRRQRLHARAQKR